jgi:hypothetical protein
MDNDVKGLYKLCGEILLEEGFFFSHCYWELDGNKHPVAESDDCDCPAIQVYCPKENGDIGIQSVVETDSFSTGVINIENESQLRAVLSALILLIKNWHQRLIKLEDLYKEELIFQQYE